MNRDDRSILEEILERVKRLEPGVEPEPEPRPSDGVLVTMLIDIQRALEAHPGGPGKAMLRSMRARVLSGKMTNSVFTSENDWLSQELRSQRLTPTPPKSE